MEGYGSAGSLHAVALGAGGQGSFHTQPQPHFWQLINRRETIRERQQKQQRQQEQVESAIAAGPGKELSVVKTGD